MLEPDILAEAKKNIKKISTIKLDDMPLNKSFECPFCHYYSKNCRQGSAKIYSNTMLFKCFSCNARRRVI